MAKAAAAQAREDVYQARAALGLPPQVEDDKDLTAVPPDLDQTFSAVRTAQGELTQTMTQLGEPLLSTGLTPKQALDEFEGRAKNERRRSTLP